MKRFVTVTVIFLILFVAAVSLARYMDLESDRSNQENKEPPAGELLISNSHKSNSHESTPPTSKPSQDILQDILLVNAENPLPKYFRPETLVNLYVQQHRHFQLAEIDIEVSKTVFEAMDLMFEAALQDGVDGFIITSGYRSYEQQVEVFANSPDGIAAQPGTSEHEAGLAFDVTAYGNENFELTPQFEWLSEHCSEYGFILRYLKGKEDVTGVPFEPWHYRYVGTPYAKEIMDAGITLEEYLEQR